MRVTTTRVVILVSIMSIVLLGTLGYIYSQTLVDIGGVVKEFKLNCHAPPAECNCRAELFKHKLTPIAFQQMVELLKKPEELDALVFEGRLVDETVSGTFVEVLIRCSN